MADEKKATALRERNDQLQSFIQTQVEHKQQIQQVARQRRIDSPDAHARTGYPALNSPTREIRAAEAKAAKAEILNAALFQQQRVKAAKKDAATRRKTADEARAREMLGRQLQEENERRARYVAEERGLLKRNWERQAQLKSIEARLHAMDGMVS